MNFFSELSARNYPLFVFGGLSLIGAIVMMILSWTSTTQVLGINAFIKPFKFFLSTTIFVWSMGWYLHYLDSPLTLLSYQWTVIITLSFELIWITFKAWNGELSHFNGSTSFNALMFSIMGLAISIMTLYTLYIGILFFQSPIDLSPSYLWGIRLGILCFVIFAFQGGLMGAQLSHTVGAPDGGPGLPLVNWSTQWGDLRIAHFVGMHALQILPILGFYAFGSARSIIVFSVIYFGICMAVFIQAMMKTPLIRM